MQGKQILNFEQIMPCLSGSFSTLLVLENFTTSRASAAIEYTGKFQVAEDAWIWQTLLNKRRKTFLKLIAKKLTVVEEIAKRKVVP